MLATMDRLGIDDGIRDLVRQLWKHCYRTSYSCEGHGSEGYIIFTGGDGWFEEKAPQYGLERVINKPCCEKKHDETEWFKIEASKYELRPIKNPCCEKNPYELRCCRHCGAGINGNIVYEGMLVQNPLKPEYSYKNPDFPNPKPDPNPKPEAQADNQALIWDESSRDYYSKIRRLQLKYHRIRPRP